MKSKEENKPVKMVEGPEKALLSLVSDRLKGKVLFPHKLEAAKEFLKGITVAKF